MLNTLKLPQQEKLRTAIVCMANIARSRTFEHVLRKKVGRNVEVLSYGAGNPSKIVESAPAQNKRRAAKDEGKATRINDFRSTKFFRDGLKAHDWPALSWSSRVLTPEAHEDIKNIGSCDIILAVGEREADRLKSLLGQEHHHKISTIKEFITKIRAKENEKRRSAGQEEVNSEIESLPDPGFGPEAENERATLVETCEKQAKIIAPYLNKLAKLKNARPE